ncbi:MAG: ABC transporter ATP-binding protein [Planctomycetes bacterium]|nr:ABC transporter ATP-binding protein [Planctomycetota bacterium]
MTESNNQNIKSVVTFKDVSFAYDNHQVLNNVNLELTQRDFISIVGPNGSGKTTILKLILGLITPQKGNITVLNKSPQNACAQVGYVPQHSQVDPHFPVNVTDVVLMGRLGHARSLGPFRSTDHDLAQNAIKQMDLDDLKTQSFSTLSGGQRQRVLIARALAGQPQLLLLDEPTSNLDLAAEIQLHQYLDKISRQTTVIIVSHDIGFVTEYVRTVVCVTHHVQIHHTHEMTGDFIQKMYGADIKLVCHDHSKYSGDQHEHCK